MLALLAPLASLLGIEASDIKDRLQRQAILFSVIGAFGLIAVIFVLVAINSALTAEFGPVVAPLIIAGASLMIAIVVLLIMQLQNSAAERRKAEKRHDAEIASLATTAAISALPLILRSPLLKQVAVPAAAALAAAFLLRRSKSPRHED